MATRNYVKVAGAPMNPDQLAALINATMTWQGTEVLLGITPTLVVVTHALLTADADTQIQAVIDSYIFDPDWGVAPERVRLRNTVATLRQWATDAATEANAWAGQTAAQRDAAMKITFQRLGTLFDRLADVIAVEGLNER